MTAPRDVDFAGWLDGIGFKPANSERKQLGHEAARQTVAEVGRLLHGLLPAGRDKSLVFTHLEEVLMRANRALALGGGPDDGIDDYTLQRLTTHGPLESDPRVEQYKAEQRGEGPAATAAPSPDADSLYIDIMGGNISLTQTTDGNLQVAVNGAWYELRPRENAVIPTWQTDANYDGAATFRASTTSASGAPWVLDMKAQPWRVEIATRCATPSLVRDVAREVLEAKHTDPESIFNGFVVEIDSPDHLAAVLRELAAAGEYAFGSVKEETPE